MDTLLSLWTQPADLPPSDSALPRKLSFPVYLLPPLPFTRRRTTPPSPADLEPTSSTVRRESTASTHSRTTAANLNPRLDYDFTSSSSPTTPTSTASSTASQTLHCSRCSSALCFTTSIISKGFTGRHGRAYLLSHLETDLITLGPPVSRPLVTGMHTVVDVACKGCGNVLGWKYVDAEEERQKYKIGKWILERERVRVGGCVAGEREVGAVEREVEEVLRLGDVDLGDEGERERMFRGVL